MFIFKKVETGTYNAIVTLHASLRLFLGSQNFVEKIPTYW